MSINRFQKTNEYRKEKKILDKKFTRIFSFILAFMMLLQFSMPTITSFAYDEKEQGLVENNVDVKKENEKISKNSNKAPPKMVEPLKLDEKKFRV